ncbi:hypothetical protein BDN67DRAFT_993291 [Paxillus ammoniavirescens]|nr:hypothetical protein BDN67DRAFT_993291 [Paxillus ammoniavirescens]
MSVVLQQTSAWPGFANIKFMMIFGDSYSSVGYLIETHPHPTPSNPLGIPFPGHTYATQRQLWRRVASEEQPNWVGHLITKYSPGTNYRKGTKREGLANLVPSKDHAPSDSSLVVFDFAKGGATITDVQSQISKQFVLIKPERATWAAEDSLFVTWVGINDCAFYLEAAGSVRKLFEDHELLYEAGTRNFLFIDVPPIARSPAGRGQLLPIHPQWNEALNERAQQFAAKHADASVMIFSSWDTFSRILDDPASYGFDASEKFGGIWVDQLHPTTKVHDILAREISKFLNDVVQSPSAE